MGKKTSATSKQIITTTTDTVAAASLPFFRSRTVRIVQNFLLVWLDAKIDEHKEDFKYSLTQLRNIVNTVEVFIDADQCIDYLKSIKDEKIFLIVSGKLGKKTVSLVHNMTQLDTIFVFCRNKERHKQWAKDWSKVRHISTSIESICKRLKKVARECDHDKIPMSFLPKQIMIEAASSQQNINQLEPSYMYSVLFKEIILEMDADDVKPINDLVVYCRQQQISETQLKYFQNKYHQKSPIWWYTCECFLYGMLNKALRLLDMEAMTKMGFFIRNLHRQLEQVHKEQLDAYKKQFIVYRGQGLTQQDFNHLVDTKGGLLSFNNFLSTSKQQKEAMRFVEDALRKYEHNVGVLFIITIDPSRVSTSKTPFAIIDDYSAFPQEQEILFSMHTVFRVGEIKRTVNNSRLWEVELTLTDDNDPQLAALTRCIEGELYGSTGWHRLGHLMLKLSHFNQAEELYNELLKNSSSDSDKADIYHMLGWLKTDQGQYKEAASFY
ncbi:unnamed protein product [Rotaria sp. Silwood2]|nr:unnamed protein product [Rotaria sp. Silwood2]CAF4022967.1 unnamed protein product [Rotaria sp. Silwood2]CAF4314907.1 unnamed protein product [Rotaria sp. Silwood2]